MVYKTRIRSKQKPPGSGPGATVSEKDCVRNNIMYSDSVLKPRARVYFDPTNDDHVQDYANFLKHSNWKQGCNYLLEQPFYDIPSMINSKLIRHFLKPFFK